MPPRISRLQWPRLFPRHEPLLFLYPRWFTVEAAAAQEASTVATEDPTAVERQDQAADQGASNHTHVRREGDELRLHGRTRWPSVAKRKEAIHRKEEIKRKELHGKAFWAQDWHTPLALLRAETPSNPRYHVKQLERLDMPQGMRGYYQGILKELFLDVYLHTGCHVQVSRECEAEDGSFVALDLAGTGATIGLAKTILNNAIHVKSDDDLNAKGKMGDYHIKGIPTNSDTNVRAVWNVPPPQDASTIRMPPVWTTSSFANYVHALVTSEAPTLHETKKRTKTNFRAFDSHVDDIINKLSSLFEDERAIRQASAHAASQALHFMLQHRRLPLVRTVLEKLEKLSGEGDTLFLTPALFNTCMRAAAQAADLHSYNFLLRMMGDRSIAPNHDTWASLALLVQSRTPRNTRHVIAAMRVKNVWLSPGSRIALANTLIAHDFDEWITRRDSAESFLANYDVQWEGTEWMDHFSANIMIEKLLSRGEFEEAHMIYDTLITRNRAPNLVTLHTFLGAAVVHKHLPLAAFALKNILPRFPNVRPNPSTYDRLAKLAFEKRAYNTLRVVWRYACMSGHVSGSLKHKMQESLLTCLPTNTSTALPDDIGIELDTQPQISRPALFKALAAKTAIGITRCYEANDFDATPSDYPTPDPSDMTSRPDVKARQQEKEIKGRKLGVLKSDLEVAGLYTPVKSLEEAFEEAVERDRVFALEGKGKVTELKVILEGMMDVEVRKGRWWGTGVVRSHVREV